MLVPAWVGERVVQERPVPPPAARAAPPAQGVENFRVEGSGFRVWSMGF